MTEENGAQFIKVYFDFVDSKLFTRICQDPYSLYLVMRRYVCRARSGHKLSEFYRRSYLATEGYTRTWASILGVSKSTIARWLQVLEDEKVIKLYQHSQNRDQLSIYILGVVEWVPGSNRAIEKFFIDHVATAQDEHEFVNECRLIPANEVAWPEHVVLSLADLNPAVPSAVPSVGHQMGQQMGRSNREENREENNLPPVGGGYVSDKALVVHDLDDVAWEMEGTGHKKDELTAGCTECGASHSQETNVCPDCGAVVVWLNSKAWKKAFGDPRAAIRQFEGIDLKAATPLEIDFCTAFNRKPQFANATQQKEFRRLARQYPDGYLRELMGWAQGKGFTALKSAVDNPDNLTKYRAKHDIVETLDEEPEVYRPRGWEIFAVAEE